MPVLKTLVEPVIKMRFRSMAKALELSESEFLRDVILEAIGQEVGIEQPIEPDAHKADLDRMTVRMPRFLMEATKKRAKLKGMAASRYVSALLQSNLTAKPVMSDYELTVLLESNRELASIGRNITHIARSLNASFHESERVRLDKLAELHLVLIENRTAIRTLVRASQNAWEVK